MAQPDRDGPLRFRRSGRPSRERVHDIMHEPGYQPAIPPGPKIERWRRRRG
jgi:hypothetical protein